MIRRNQALLQIYGHSCVLSASDGKRDILKGHHMLERDGNLQSLTVTNDLFVLAYGKRVSLNS